MPKVIQAVQQGESAKKPMVRLAKKALRKSDHRSAFHGVVVYRGGSLLAVGYNRGSIHAEVQALSKLWPSERKGTKVISIRVGRNGKTTIAKPCPKCEAYLREQGVKLVVYSDEDGLMRRMKL
jgi:deoxycytidylate deaminase